MQIKKRCIICGNEFIADRRTAKYCSEKCHRQSKSIKAHEEVVEQRIVKQKENSMQPETMERCRHPDCYYRSAKNTVPTCDYILRTGMPRGCKVSECDKYKPRGKEKNKTIVIFDRLTEEEKAIRNGQYEALSLRLDQYETQRRHSKERK